mgnify:CR=1 FL=1
MADILLIYDLKRNIKDETRFEEGLKDVDVHVFKLNKDKLKFYCSFAVE